MIYSKRMRENYVINVTKFLFLLCLFCVKLMPKSQEFIVHYMTFHMRENNSLTWINVMVH